MKFNELSLPEINQRMPIIVSNLGNDRLKKLFSDYFSDFLLKHRQGFAKWYTASKSWYEVLQTEGTFEFVYYFKDDKVQRQYFDFLTENLQLIIEVLSQVAREVLRYMESLSTGKVNLPGRVMIKFSMQSSGTSIHAGAFYMSLIIFLDYLRKKPDFREIPEIESFPKLGIDEKFEILISLRKILRKHKQVFIKYALECREQIYWMQNYNNFAGAFKQAEENLGLPALDVVS